MRATGGAAAAAKDDAAVDFASALLHPAGVVKTTAPPAASSSSALGGGKGGKHPRRTERRPIPAPLVDSLCNPLNLLRYSTFSWVRQLRHYLKTFFPPQLCLNYFLTPRALVTGVLY